ncbi:MULTISPECIES: ATP-binding protein [Lysobacter]|uniref:histidine kinase n=2 Tax=Lysobacter TaxID=68 RepID=A0A0S2DME8_LYSEN|nr:MULTISPECIES: ATP-binding protein [Lysobacter]ALN59682.1 sensor histidine kinase [Lysobacter enzymogenes]QCW27790.1 sensor histidine kinase [Lysobacter enzymogenes]QQQ02273.1 sensor histidine kinase [Lysobacter enzymogenes]UZW61550.1 ATP-binding protein [Lysobacter enzymogenes]WMT05414.1 ATP-binding protein [Lysobacter yananisis]
MSWGQPRSLRARQLLAASLGLLAFLALAGVALDRAFLETAENNLRQRLTSYALAYAADTDFGRGGEIIPPYDPPDPRFDRPGSGLYAEVILPNDHWDSVSAQGPVLPNGGMLKPAEESFEGPLPLTEINGKPGEAYRYGRGLIWSVDGDPRSEFQYTILILEDTSALRHQVGVFRQALWRYLGGAGVILLLLQALIMQWSLRPLKRVIEELKRVQRGMASRMSERHPRELEPLTESINAFIESERENLDRQRNTLADLAHSLKTPLAVLRARLDDDSGAQMDKELREDLDLQLRRMNELVSYQLARAASGGHALFAAPIAIEPHAEEIVRGLEKVYASKGILCEFDLADGVQFHGEPGDLQELLGNLLENAFKWANSRVLLTVKPGETAAQRRPGLLLAVDDDGPGIPAEKVAKILQRGVRGDERVHGHGIGLAIVQDLVRGYRGTLDVTASEELGGTRFEVKLPPGL